MKKRTSFPKIPLRTITLFILLLSQPGFAQTLRLPVDSVTHKATYAETVTLDHPNPSLYANARTFFLQEQDRKHPPFGQSDNTYMWTFDDDTQKLKARGSLPYGLGSLILYIPYNLVVQVYEGSYSYSFTGFQTGEWPRTYFGGKQGGNFDTDDPGGIPKHRWEKIKEYVDKEIRKRIEDLKKTMSETGN